MKKLFAILPALALFFILLVPRTFALSPVLYNGIPDQIPGNVPSQGFQCCQGFELGDEIKLAGSTRRSEFVTVLMSSWSLHSSYPDMSEAGYQHPITLNIYKDDATARSHSPMKSITQTFTIPWRPEPDSSCGSAWKDLSGKCYNGFAFKVVFDLRELSFDLPDQFIYGIAYNTNTWGYDPIGRSGPYESLNIGLSNINDSPVFPTVGTDINPDVVYWNTKHGPFYTDGGAGGINIFRQDRGWLDYPIAIKFTGIGVPENKEQCKDGGWKSFGSMFKNQGNCISYIQSNENAGKR